MRTYGQAITRPSIELSLVVSLRELEHYSEDELVEKAGQILRHHFRSSKQHYADHPPIEFIRSVSETNQITREEQ